MPLQGLAASVESMMCSGAAARFEEGLSMELEELVTSCQNSVKKSILAIQDVGVTGLVSVDPDRQSTRSVLDPEIFENKVCVAQSSC